jgi:SNF2 family DNA or RNA helicase
MCSLPQGLGKTVQTIAFVAALLGKGGFGAGRPPPRPPGAAEERIKEPSRDPRERQPILILCPSSVVANWQREFSTWGELLLSHSASLQ